MPNKIQRYLMLFTLVSVVPMAQAMPIYWSLQNVFFSDGSALTGGFIIDPISNHLIDMDISTTDGAMPGFHYTNSSSVVLGMNVWNVNPHSFVIGNINPFAQPYLSLSFSNPLTSVASNYLVLSTSTNGTLECGGNNCNAVRFAISGSAESVAISLPTTVPEPSYLGLTSLAVLLWLTTYRHGKSTKYLVHMPMVG
jgi:hypothetical protein